MGDFNLPDNCTGEMVDAAHAEPDRDKTCMWCCHCIEECCDMGLCDCKLAASPLRFDSWQEAVDYMEAARVDMQVDTCARWEEF